jgi:hypothetical protein
MRRNKIVINGLAGSSAYANSLVRRSPWQWLLEVDAVEGWEYGT